MKVSILGCGSSVGVPSIRCKCLVCLSDDPKNKRLRTSALISFAGLNILIDTSPDLRYQALRASCNKVHAVIYTHAHFDHCAGINELASFEPISDDNSIPIYSDALTAQHLMRANLHLFEKVDGSQKKNYLVSKEVEYYKPFYIPRIDMPFMITEQQHGTIKSSGIIVGDFAYCTDFNDMKEESLQFLQKANLKLIVIECLRYSEAVAHINLKLCLDWLSKIRPKKALLTHMSHEIEYHSLKKELEYYSKELDIEILPAYDNLTVVV